MKNLCLWTILCLISFVTAGCSTVALRLDSYQPGTPQAQKIPLKVAVVSDKKAKPPPLDINQVLYSVKLDIDVEPGFSNAIKAELGNIFEEVRSIEDPREAKEGDNLVAYPRLKIKEAGPMAIEVRMELAFREVQSRMPVSKFEKTETMSLKPPASVLAGAAVTGGTLFLGAPLTLPMMASAHADKILEDLNAAIPPMIRDIAKDVTDDRNLLVYARSLTGKQPGAVAESQEPLPPMSDVDTLPVVKSSLNKKNAYAIVIGIERYREKLPKADFADRDAKLMGDYLTKVLGFPEENVVVRLNEKAGRTDIEKYVESWLPNHVDQGDSVFIYFSGHGAPNAKTGEAYLVPYDGDPTFVDTTGYPLKRLYENLGKLPAGDVTVLLDSCFSGAGGRSVIAKGMRPMVLSVENPLMTKGKTMVLAASAGDQVSSTYAQKGHGLLTYFFLKGLHGDADANKDGTIDLAELFEYVKPQVERTARREYNNEQTPQLLAPPELPKKVRLLKAATP